jgi:hypothetical protein
VFLPVCTPKPNGIKAWAFAHDCLSARSWLRFLFFFSPSLSSFSFSFLLKRRQIGFSCSFLVSPPQLRTNGDNDDGCTPRTEEEGQMPPQRRLDSDRDTIKGRVTTKEKEREREESSASISLFFRILSPRRRSCQAVQKKPQNY